MFTLTEVDGHLQDLFLGMQSTETPKDKWIVHLLIHDHHTVSFKTDSGAQANVMSLRAKPFCSSSIWLITYSGENCN